LHCGIPRLKLDKESANSKRFFFAALVFLLERKTRPPTTMLSGIAEIQARSKPFSVVPREQIWVMMKLNSVFLGSNALLPQRR
jgi:hypothetical protein